jgi:signal transduction histidine kinase
VLVVDDTPTNIQVLFDLLDAAGYRVAIAKSGEIALQRIQRHLPDLILLDVMMPGMDGFEVCRRLKADPQTRDIPVLFMTALTDTVNKVQGLQLGAVDYLTKPIQHEEVMARIRVHLQLRSLQRSLEQQVRDRTAELNQALEDLQATQVQLIHGEKMSALGQLVAGIAHEINNPVNFFYGTLQPAEGYITDLLDLIELFCTEFPELTPVLRDRIEAIELDFVREDLPSLIRSMQLGTQRIRNLVLSLRNFSRLDESAVKSVDLHEGLDSTLVILHNRMKLKPHATEVVVVKHYGPLPRIQCYPSQLNQVFMNLLGNALDALEDGLVTGKLASDHVPEVRITTQAVGDRVEVAIADNGPGIPEAIQTKIFDAFFTTKPVNKGTGLGLSISHQIVTDLHGGRLICHSQPGQGTEFIIDLPPQIPAS